MELEIHLRFLQQQWDSQSDPLLWTRPTGLQNISLKLPANEYLTNLNTTQNNTITDLTANTTSQRAIPRENLERADKHKWAA
jgi:hypothetical protein